MILIVILLLFALITTGIYTFQNKLIFFPEVLTPNYLFEFNSEFEELNYQTSDGETINALHFKIREPKGIIFYSHGNAGSLRTWGQVAEIFLRHNYDLLVYDYRGYGKSSGNVSEEYLYQDAEMIYGGLKKSFKEENIIVYGRSIGTGVASKIASVNNPKFLILESPYYNLPDLAKKIFPFIPSKLIKFKLRNDEHITRIQCPITVFHGTSDEVIYFGSALKLEKLFKEGDKLIAINGGHHNDLANFELYHEELERILQ